MSIITRSGWGARAPSAAIYRAEWSERDLFVVHHSATPESATLRSIQNYHMDSNGWVDIGYNAAVDFKGRQYEGRAGGLRAVGAHVRGYNERGYGIVYIGDGDHPTNAGKAALRDHYEHVCAMAEKRLTMTYHSAYSPTHCPGTKLRMWVKEGMPYPEGDDMGYSEAEMKGFSWEYNGRGIANNDLTPEGNKSTLWVLDQIWRHTNAIPVVEDIARATNDTTLMVQEQVDRVLASLEDLDAVETRLSATMSELVAALRRIADALAGESGGQ